MSIRSRLLLLVLAVLLPAVLASLWIVDQALRSERELAESGLRDSSRALSIAVGRELMQRSSMARVLAMSSALDRAPDLSPADLALFEQQARRAMQGFGGWLELRAGDRVLVDTRTPPSPPGADTPASVPAARANAGTSYASFIVQPVQRRGRNVLDIRVTILPQELQAIVDQQQREQPADWVTTVLDAQARVVARHPHGAAMVGRGAGAEFGAMLAGNREGVFQRVSLDGVPVTGFFTTSGQGWTFASALPRPVLGGVPRTVVPVALGVVTLLVLAVGGALRVAGRIATPVYSLKASAARLQAGLPVERLSTGIVECDEVQAALAEAGEAIQHARQDMARQVDAAVARTREAEQRLSHSQRIEALGRLTGGVAHDFNNLLGVISNSAHLIQRRAAGHDVQAPVAATLRAVDVGSRLTQHLLRFAGRQPVRPKAVELRIDLPELQDMIQAVLGKRVQMSLSVLPGTRRVTVDSSELELALINLALNARDALPTGGRLWVEARNADALDTEGLTPGDYVLIAVSDDGMGFEPEVVSRAFEPFFTTKTGKGQGTGLGLSQVHGFCVQAGGTARLASTPGLGTTVSLILPAAVELPAATSPPDASAQPPATPPDERIRGARVLLVEDNEELADVTEALLDSFGCHVRRASSAAQALALLNSTEPAPRGLSVDDVDVLLSDVVMPGDLDGVELARALRRQRAELPVVLISGYSTALNGTHEFTVLRKPCAPQALVEALADAMRSPVHAA